MSHLILLQTTLIKKQNDITGHSLVLFSNYFSGAVTTIIFELQLQSIIFQLSYITNVVDFYTMTCMKTSSQSAVTCLVFPSTLFSNVTFTSTTFSLFYPFLSSTLPSSIFPLIIPPLHHQSLSPLSSPSSWRTHPLIHVGSHGAL